MESKSSGESKAGSYDDNHVEAETKTKDGHVEGKEADGDPDRSPNSKRRSNDEIYDDDAMPNLSDTSDVAIMKRASRYCFSHAFIDVFQQYIEEHAEIFYPAVDEEEHRLEYTDSFNDYLKVFEDTMEGWLQQEDITLPEFFEVLQRTQEQGDVYDKYFMGLLQASAEYDCYFKVMVQEATKQLKEQDNEA